MIKNISIKNFKSLKENSFLCKKFNIFTGMNGMGKSTLIQSLLVLRQSYQKGLFYTDENYLTFDDYLASIGSYRDAIYAEFDKEQDFIEIDIEFSENQAKWKTHSYYNDKSTGSEVLLETNPFPSTVFKEALFSKNKFQFIKAERIGPRDVLNTNTRNVQNKDFGSDGAFAMHYFLENATKINIPIAALKHENENNLLLELQMNAWLNEISPNIKVKSELIFDKITPKFGYHSNGIPRGTFSAKNTGFGVSYIFSVVLAIITAEPDDLIIIENPEAHLHPSGQSKLAQLMALAAQNGVQIFVETHSDHIINGSLVACKKGLISNENMNIQYFERQSENLYSDNIEVKVLEKGRIKYAPEGFFDQIAKDITFLMTTPKL